MPCPNLSDDAPADLGWLRTPLSSPFAPSNPPTLSIHSHDSPLNLADYFRFPAHNRSHTRSHSHSLTVSAISSEGATSGGCGAPTSTGGAIEGDRNPPRQLHALLLFLRRARRSKLLAVVDSVAVKAFWNHSEPQLSTTRLQIIQYKIVKIMRFQQISITR